MAPIDWSAILQIAPQLALAVLVVYITRDLQTRAQVQIKELLDRSEQGRAEARTDFIKALEGERVERQADSASWQARVDALTALVASNNALLAQHDAMSREAVNRLERTRKGDTL